MSSESIFILALLNIALWLLISYTIIYVRHRRSIPKLKQLSTLNFEFSQKDVDIKLYWRSGMKDYLSLISSCDIYFHQDFFVVTPFQTFPFKAYHPPVVFIRKNSLSGNTTSFSKHYEIDKLELNKFNRKEIELQYGDRYNKYRIKFKNLYKAETEKLEMMKNYC